MVKPMFYVKSFLLSKRYNSEEMKKLPQYKLSFLKLQNDYGIIDNYTYDIETTKILMEDKTKEEKDIALLNIERKYDKIDNLEYTKRFNDAKGKSWVAIHTDYDADSDEDNMELEVVYNKTFIKNMRKKGLPGDSDEEIAEQWLKLFLIANLDEDDLALLNEDEDESKSEKYVTREKLGDKTVIK